MFNSVTLDRQMHHATYSYRYAEVCIRTFNKRALKMNKWSTSLPSIISLCNDVQVNYDPMFMQQSTTTALPTSNINSNGGKGSLTDMSILIQTQSPFANYNNHHPYPTNFTQSSKITQSAYDTSIEHETTIQTDFAQHEQFVPDDELLQSLVAYADSFDLDASVYSVQNLKSPPTTQMSLRRRTQSSTTHLTSMIENDPLTRHKSCDDLSMVYSITSNSTSKPTTVVPKEEHPTKTNPMKFVPSETHPQFLFAAKPNENNRPSERKYEEKPREQNTTTTFRSKSSEWGFSSDTMNELNRPTADLYSNYEATMNIGDINSNYLKDLEQFSSMAASMNFSPEIPTPAPPPPMIIRKKSKDFLLKQQVDIQLLRPPTPPPPAPIIIREIRRKPPPSTQPRTIHQQLETTGQIHLSKTPSPVVFRERPPLPPRQEFPSKPTIFYRHLPTPPPSPPTVIMERLRPHVSTVIQKPAPILVEKWLPYPPEQKRKIIYERASPLPGRNKHQAHDQAKHIIVEYDNVNVIVNKDVKRRKDIKRVSPQQYLKQYGKSLYSNESLNHLLANVTSPSHMKHEYPMAAQQHHYGNYSSMFH